MNKKIGFGIVTLTTLLILVVSVIYFSYEESNTFKGFPVPKNAELTDNKVNFEAYYWAPASEENGLPLRYRTIIKLWGWDKKEQMGSLTVYHKDGKEIDVISQRDYLSLSVFED